MNEIDNVVAIHILIFPQCTLLSDSPLHSHADTSEPSSRQHRRYYNHMPCFCCIAYCRQTTHCKTRNPEFLCKLVTLNFLENWDTCFSRVSGFHSQWEYSFRIMYLSLTGHIQMFFTNFNKFHAFHVHCVSNKNDIHSDISRYHTFISLITAFLPHRQHCKINYSIALLHAPYYRQSLPS